MNLKIGTILIAKESFGDYTKDKEYSILENDRDVNYKVSSDNSTVINWLSDKAIEKHFTIKRYTLSDLQTRTDLMVRIENEEQAKKLQDAGLAFVYKSYYEPYYGFTEGFVWLTKSEQQGRTLLESIDIIDLEVKEEVKETYICKYCGATFSKDVDEEDCYLSPKNNHEQRQDTFVDNLESEIVRLKGELAELETALRVTTKKLGDATSQDLTKRERMAWELVIKSAKKTSCIGIDSAFEYVDTFLAKSKEVKK